MSRSTRTFFFLVFVLALMSAANLFLPQGNSVPAINVQALPAPLPVMALVIAAGIMVLYGGLGYLGLALSRKLGLPDLWSKAVSNRQRFATPALIGALLGVFLIAGDQVFSCVFAQQPFPHPPFPTSIVASLSAGIGEEIIFRLFFISFWTWLISNILLHKKAFVLVYWIISTLSALAFGASHFPSVMILSGANSFSQISPALVAEVFLLNGIIGLIAAYYFKKTGYLAAAGVHFWADMVWHVIWGLF